MVIEELLERIGSDTPTPTDLKRLEEDIVKLRETGADKAYLCRMLGMLGGIFLLILVL